MRDDESRDGERVDEATIRPWWRRPAFWTNTLVVVSIVATGVVVAGLTRPPERPSEDPRAAVEDYLTPPVQYPAQIPGCDAVEPPSAAGWTAYSSFGEQTYDNPDEPWFSGPKATAMAQALAAALPPDAEVDLAMPLAFDPIADFGGDEPEDVPGWTSLWTYLDRGSGPGEFNVQVANWDRAVPACVAGDLVRRVTGPDGTVVDLQETWYQVAGFRTFGRSATGYLPDGSAVLAQVSDQVAVGTDGQPETAAAFPLTLDELTTIVTAPGLRVTAPVPPGTPAPRESCSVDSESTGRELTREDLDRLGGALGAAWRAGATAGVTLDGPLDALQLGGAGRNAVCVEVGTAGPGGTGTLTVGIGGGHRPPVPLDPYDPAAEHDRTEIRSLPDGSVSARTGPDGQYGAYRQVAVTRPSGTQVSVSWRGPELPTFEQLESLAVAPGLDLP